MAIYPYLQINIKSKYFNNFFAILFGLVNIYIYLCNVKQQETTQQRVGALVTAYTYRNRSHPVHDADAHNTFNNKK